MKPRILVGQDARRRRSAAGERRVSGRARAHAAWRFLGFCLLFCAAIGSSAGDGGAVDFSRQSIRITLSTEPPNLNSLTTTDQISHFVLGHVMEGLLQYDARGALAAGVAQRWELRDDGATFWLRRDARWSDGKAVTARDFVFAWREALLPATASRYASVLFPVKNAERINRGELPAAALGVRALGDYQLEVRFERPCPYFLGLTAFVTYLPVREDFYRSRGERYGADNGDLLYNGAFVLSRWQHGARLTLTRNENYWDKAQIHLREIDIPYITSDPTATFNLFQEGSIALAQLGTETFADALAQGLPLKLFNTGTIYFLEFNLRPGRLTANRNLRKAIQAVFAPAELVNKVVGLPGLLPGASLFPRTVKGLHGALRDEYPAPLPPRGLRLAREYLQRARSEFGARKLPPLVILINDSSRGRREAEYYQQLLAVGLGLDVRIDSQTFKQYLDKMTRGEFDITIAGWGADFDDPITFGNLFASWNENNRGRYRSAEYDHWVKIAESSADQPTRMAAFAAMQRLLVEDAPILPTYENAQVYVQHPRLLGVVRSFFDADPNFRYARVVAP
jgi:oligopeptide transport system substrate-binding protein